MERKAFKKRMQQLRTYREQNPGKSYLDFKAYQDGGQVDGFNTWKKELPNNLQDETSYNLKRAYELGYKPEWNEEDKSYHLPTRDSSTGEILKKPWHNTFLIGLNEDAKLGYYPQRKNNKTYTTTWEGNEKGIPRFEYGGQILDNYDQYLSTVTQMHKYNHRIKNKKHTI